MQTNSTIDPPEALNKVDSPGQMTVGEAIAAAASGKLYTSNVSYGFTMIYSACLNYVLTHCTDEILLTYVKTIHSKQKTIAFHLGD